MKSCDEETTQLCCAVAEGKAPEIKPIYKKKTIQKEYFFNRKSPFFGKCAYCETPILDFQHGDIDHFRPKLSVTDENDQPIYLKDSEGNLLLDKNDNVQLHPGYYWLAYDWRNLLPTCMTCNRPKIIGMSKIGKHSRFPVIGVHAQSPNEIASEQPLLINPLSEHKDDDPEKHLTIDTTTGVMGDRTERGKICINMFGLNLREQLRDERKNACSIVRILLVKLATGNQKDKDDAAKELKKILAGYYPYTMAGRSTFTEFNKSYNSIVNRNGDNHE